MKVYIEMDEDEARSFFNWRVIADCIKEVGTISTPPRIATPKTQHHKRKRYYAPWTREEVKALRHHYEKFTRRGATKIRRGKVQNIARRLHRTPEAVCVKAGELGFTNHKEATA